MKRILFLLLMLVVICSAIGQTPPSPWKVVDQEMTFKPDVDSIGFYFATGDDWVWINWNGLYFTDDSSILTEELLDSIYYGVGRFGGEGADSVDMVRIGGWYVRGDTIYTDEFKAVFPNCSVGTTIWADNAINIGGYLGMNYDGPDGDVQIYFYDNSSAFGEFFMWDDVPGRFYFSHSTHIAGSLSVAGNLNLQDYSMDSVRVVNADTILATLAVYLGLVDADSLAKSKFYIDSADGYVGTKALPGSGPADNQILKYNAGGGTWAYESDATGAGGETGDTTIFFSDSLIGDSVTAVDNMVKVRPGTGIVITLEDSAGAFDVVRLRTELGSFVDSTELTDASVSEADLTISNSTTDEHVLTWEADAGTGGQMTWEAQSGGGAWNWLDSAGTVAHGTGAPFWVDTSVYAVKDSLGNRIHAYYTTAGGHGHIELTSDEWTEDVAGAMATGNTETGITVTYQDGDGGTIDYEVDVTVSDSTAAFADTLKDPDAASAVYMDNDTLKGMAAIHGSLAAVSVDSLVVANTYWFTKTDGTADQVLTTNGSGAVTWNDQTGGGGGGDVTDVIGGNGLVDDGSSGAITLDVRPGYGIDTTADLVVVDTTNEIASRAFARDSTAYEFIADPEANGSIAFGSYTGTYTSATDGWDGIMISNTVANHTVASALLNLHLTQDGDVDGLFLVAMDNSATDTMFRVAAGGDTYIQNDLEVGQDITAGDDITVGISGTFTVQSIPWNIAGTIDGEQLADNSVDDDAIDWGGGAGQVSATDMPDFGTMTATSANILIGDGTDFETQSVSGDGTIAANGTLNVTFSDSASKVDTAGIKVNNSHDADSLGGVAAADYVTDVILGDSLDNYLDSVSVADEVGDTALVLRVEIGDSAQLRLLLAGGEMSGNITMAGAQTVDGVDLSALNAGVDADSADWNKAWDTLQLVLDDTTNYQEAYDSSQFDNLRSNEQATDVDSAGTDIAAALGTRADKIGGAFTGEVEFDAGAFKVDTTKTDSAYVTIYTADTLIHDTADVLRSEMGDTASQRIDNLADELTGDLNLYGLFSQLDWGYRIDTNDVWGPLADTMLQMDSHGGFVDTLAGQGGFGDSTFATHPSTRYLAAKWNGYNRILVYSPHNGFGQTEEVAYLQVSNERGSYHYFIDSFSTSPTYDTFNIPVWHNTDIDTVGHDHATWNYNNQSDPDCFFDHDNRDLYVTTRLRLASGAPPVAAILAKHSNDGMTWEVDTLDNGDQSWIYDANDSLTLLSFTIEMDTGESYNGWGIERVWTDATDTLWRVMTPTDTFYLPTIVVMHESSQPDSGWGFANTGWSAVMVDTQGTGFADDDSVKTVSNGVCNWIIPDTANWQPWHIQVDRISPDYYLGYLAITKRGTSGDSTKVLFATSPDGFNWITKAKPLLEPTRNLSGSQTDSAHSQRIYQGSGTYFNTGDGLEIEYTYGAFGKWAGENEWHLAQTVLKVAAPQWIKLDNVRPWGSTPEDSVVLSFPIHEGTSSYLLRDSCIGAGATAYDSFFVVGEVPFDCYIDSLEFLLKETGGAVVTSIDFRGPDRSSALGITDSSYWTDATDQSGASWAIKGYSFTNKILASAGDEFAVVFENDFSATGDVIYIGWVKIWVHPW